MLPDVKQGIPIPIPKHEIISVKGYGIITELAKDVIDLILRKRYYSALALCLIMPDICSEALYPELKREPNSMGKAYKKVWAEFIGSESSKFGIDALKGWNLRGRILHNAEGSFKDKAYHWDYRICSAGEYGYRKLPGGKVELISQPTIGIKVNSKRWHVDKDGNKIFVSAQSGKGSATIYLETLCNEIIVGCVKCYNAHSEKFSKLKYNMF